MIIDSLFLKNEKKAIFCWFYSVIRNVSNDLRSMDQRRKGVVEPSSWDVQVQVLDCLLLSKGR